MEYSVSVWTLFLLLLSVWTLILIGIPAQALFFLLLFREEMLPKRLLHINIMRVRILANHMPVLSQPDLRAQTIHASLMT